MTQLTDEMMALKDQNFYDFLKTTMGEDIRDLFHVQNIRTMAFLSTKSANEITHVLQHDITTLDSLKRKLGFTLNNGTYVLRLGVQQSIERLLCLIRSKEEQSNTRSDSSDMDNEENIIEMNLLELWSKRPNASSDDEIPMIFGLIKNITRNMKRMKNNYSYDNNAQNFAISLFVLGGRNCYEFMRANCPGALPHLSAIESMIRKQESKIIEGEFRCALLRKYLPSTQLNYVFCSEDCTGVVCRIEYDSQSNTFIGFSLPLRNGTPQVNVFRTDDYEELKSWFASTDRSTLINLHMIQPLSYSLPPFILSAYGTNNKLKAHDILNRWLHIHSQCFDQGIRIIGFSTDADPKYLRSMRLCTRFFAELPSADLFKSGNEFHLKIRETWTWFFMHERQILLFMQDGTHLATKIRNRLLSKKAAMKMGDCRIDVKHLLELVERTDKIHHGLIKCDISPKDRQNFASCRRISSDSVLHLLARNNHAKGTYIYLSLLHLTIVSYVEKSTSIEDRLYYSWILVFTCRF